MYVVSENESFQYRTFAGYSKEIAKSKAVNSLQWLKGMMSELTGGTSQSKVLIHSLNKQ